MYTLLMGLWSMLFAKVQYQVLILGLDDAGKTVSTKANQQSISQLESKEYTFLEQCKHIYSGSSPPDSLKIPPTVGLNIGKLDVSRVRLLFWDLGGQGSLRVLWDKYYEESHAVIWIVDSTDAARMEECAKEINKILHDKALIDAPVIILSNKQDLKHALEPATIAKLLHLPSNITTSPSTSSSSSASSLLSPGVSSPSSSSSSSSSTVDASLLYSEHLIRMFPISALNGDGISKAIDFLLDLLPKSRRTQQMNEKLV